MTEAIAIDPNKCVCANCWAEGERDKGYPSIVDPIPMGWGFVMITRNEGIATNSLLCDLCLFGVRTAMADRRIAVLTKPSESLGKKVAEAKEATAKTVKVTQLGAGKEAVINVSEFDDETAVKQEELESEADKARWAKQEEPSKEALQATVKEMAEQAATEAEADKNAAETRQAPTEVKPTTTRNKRRAAASKVTQVEAGKGE